MLDLTPKQQERIDGLLAEMTLAEKVAQLTGVTLRMLWDDDQKLVPAKMQEHLCRGIGQISLSGGATELPPEKTAENINTVQRFLVEGTRLGIPAIVDDQRVPLSPPADDQCNNRLARGVRCRGKHGLHLLTPKR